MQTMETTTEGRGSAAQKSPAQLAEHDLTPRRVLLLAVAALAVTAIAAHAIIFEPIPRISLMNGILVLIATPMAFIAELVIVGWRRSSLNRLLRPDRSAFVDILCWLMIITGVMDVLGHACTFGLGDWLAGIGHGATRKQLVEHIHAHPFVVAIVYLFFVDLVGYWIHRAEHTRWLWPIHRTHHSATDMNIFSTHRLNPIEVAFKQSLLALPLALIGDHFQAPMIFTGLTIGHLFMSHSAVNWKFGWFGRWVLVSPRYHRVHHAAEGPQGNYAGFFPVIDQIFGTYVPPRGDSLERVGLSAP